MKKQFLDYIKSNDGISVEKYISSVNSNIKNEALIIASEKGYHNLIELLIYNKANIHVQEDQALIEASKNNHYYVVNFLLSKGANIHAQDDQALKQASYNGYYDIVKLLLSNRANIHAEDDLALIFASREGHHEIVQLLLSNGANVNAQHNKALIYASYYGHYDIVNFLLSKGANIHAQDDRALIYASKEGHYQIVELLLSKGANVNAEDNKALKVASKKNIKHLLILYGATLLRLAPENECTDEIVTDPHFQHVCSGNTFEDKIEGDYLTIGDKNPIDPITSQPIPSNLFVSVKLISDTEYKYTSCFDAEVLYLWWLEQAKREQGISYKYASNPLTNGYFNRKSVDYVIEMLKRLGKI